jgi:D-glycero-D-manno-heptose 1,7-bisphosphate phosphatase
VGKCNLIKKRAVFLDRDGVILRTRLEAGVPTPARSLEEAELLPGAEKAVNLLKAKGFLCIVFTNQPDIKRGLVDKSMVTRIHEFLFSTLVLDEIYVCPHDDADKCECRKPKPGMILAAARRFDIDLKESYVVGDRWRDISAGQACDCECYFIDYQYPERQPTGEFKTVKTLLEMATLIPEVVLNENS